MSILRVKCNLCTSFIPIILTAAISRFCLLATLVVHSRLRLSSEQRYQASQSDSDALELASIGFVLVFVDCTTHEDVPGISNLVKRSVAFKHHSSNIYKEI